MKTIRVAVCFLLLPVCGCVQLDLSSAADRDENSKMCFPYVTSLYCKNASAMLQRELDKRLQLSDGHIEERGIQRVVISQNWWEVLVTFGTIGIIRPLEATIWLEEN